MYAATMFLNPRWKRAACVKLWGSENHADDQLVHVRRFLVENYKAAPTVANKLPTLGDVPVQSHESHLDAVLRGLDMIQAPSVPAADDELTEYLAEDLTSCNPHEYWRRPSVQLRYPRLSRMAIDLYGIPAMSDEPERVFSLGGNIVTPKRARLTEDKQEALVCLGNWMRNLDIELKLPGVVIQSSHSSQSTAGGGDDSS